ncbi:MAG: benzoyl-CoA reductase subunit C, partial [Burkholderiales bacterium]
VHELEILRDDLAKLAGVEVTNEKINQSIAVFNENRRVIRELYAYRSAEPWQVPTTEVYLLMRAGMVLPVEEHTQMLRDYLAATQAEPRTKRDNARVVINGTFCEQPPLNLIKSIEMAGCYVVDDDFMLVNRWLLDDVPTDGDALDNLSKAFLHRSAATSAKYEAKKEEKGQFLLKQVKDRKAEGVVFACPSFCDPALLERPMLQDVLSAHGVPHTAFKYAENTGQMAPIREQAGTFADSIKLWSAA